MAMSDTSKGDFNIYIIIGYIDGRFPGNASPTAADTHELLKGKNNKSIGPRETNQFQKYYTGHDPNGVCQLWHDQLEEIKEQKGLIQDLLDHVCSHADAIRPPRTPVNQMPDMQEGSQDIPLSTESARIGGAVDRSGSRYRCRESLEPERSEELLQRSDFIEFPGNGRSSRRSPLEFIRNVYCATRGRGRSSTAKSSCETAGAQAN